MKHSHLDSLYHTVQEAVELVVASQCMDAFCPESGVRGRWNACLEAEEILIQMWKDRYYSEWDCKQWLVS